MHGLDLAKGMFAARGATRSTGSHGQFGLRWERIVGRRIAVGNFNLDPGRIARTTPFHLHAILAAGAKVVKRDSAFLRSPALRASADDPNSPAEHRAAQRSDLRATIDDVAAEDFGAWHTTARNIKPSKTCCRAIQWSRRPFDPRPLHSWQTILVDIHRHRRGPFHEGHFRSLGNNVRPPVASEIALSDANAVVHVVNIRKQHPPHVGPERPRRTGLGNAKNDGIVNGHAT